MSKQHNAAFINAIADEGTKAEAIEFLQQTWDDLVNLRLAVAKLGYSLSQIETMQKTGSLHG